MDDEEKFIGSVAHSSFRTIDKFTDRKTIEIFNQEMHRVLNHYVQYPNSVQRHDDENVRVQNSLLDMI